MALRKTSTTTMQPGTQWANRVLQRGSSAALPLYHTTADSRSFKQTIAALAPLGGTALLQTGHADAEWSDAAGCRNGSRRHDDWSYAALADELYRRGCPKRTVESSICAWLTTLWSAIAMTIRAPRRYLAGWDLVFCTHVRRATDSR